MFYVLYVSGGKCRDDQAPTRNAEGKPIKRPLMLKQFYVERALRDKGVTVWEGRRAKFIRSGKNRYWSMDVQPAFPNYVFADLDDDQLLDAIRMDYVSPTFKAVGRRDLENVLSAMNATDSAYEDAQRVDQNNRASVTAYKRGDALKVASAAWEGVSFKFDALVKRPGDDWVMIEATGEMMGQAVRMRFDPIDVKAAE